ncbi:MFS transporter [Amnibacterium endophyticum]|uniref:MFS transporter n=1 Tax=Amnibacterium endophyticum TaxID=2109337 RepID=A0ABW4LEY1_9MICO
MTRPARRLPPLPAFWAVAAAFLAAMAFTTVPTPLYALYQQRDGFPTWVITVVFAAYAVGVAVSLYLVGHVSDRIGRRPPAIAAVVLEIAAAVVFIVWPGVPGLLVARLLTGLGVGALTAAATAHLGELWHRAGRGGATPASVATLANIGGLGVGPLAAGLLAQLVPLPLVVPYVVGGAALVLAAIALLLVPETVPARPWRWHPQRLRVPEEGRGAFWAAGAGAFAGFAVFGLVTALSPTFVAGEFHATSRIDAGLVPFGTLAVAAVGQVFLTRVAMRVQLVVATAAMAAGLAGLATGAVVAALPLFAGGALLAGFGVGLLFRGALATASGLVEPGERGSVLAAVFLIAYVGLTVPVLLVGAALVIAPAVPVLVVFSAVMLVLAVVAGPRMARRAA